MLVRISKEHRMRHTISAACHSVRIVAAVASAIGLTLATPLAATAHDHLMGGSPAPDSTVSRPLSAITLRFMEAPSDVLRGSTVLQVTGAGGRHFETTCASIDGTAVRSDVRLGRSGSYRVDWRVVPDDGHPASGFYSFTYAAPVGAPAATGSTTGPDCGAAASARSARRGEPAVPPGMLGGGLLVLLVAGSSVAGTRLLQRRAERTHAPVGGE
jgi:methionine-rich copper-binding protein CopC